MEELKRYIFNGEEYISKKSLLKCLREISDAVNSFSDRSDPIRAQGANKVISLLLEEIEPPQERWKPSEGQLKQLLILVNYFGSESLRELYEQLKKLM